MRYFLNALLILFSLSAFSQEINYELVWSDEFDGNGAINTNNWFHQTLLPDGNSWYNGEIQHYTNRQVNSSVSNGILRLLAKKETFTDQGVTKEYTSARLNSKVAFTYGLVEARAKLPSGVGTWPAIWTLGKNIIEPGGYWSDEFGTVGWPACGEIDIMEHWGSNQDYVQSATHTPSSFGNTINLGGQTIPNASNEFHVYTLEWTSEKMVFSVDDVEHYTYNPPVKDASTWPFDTEQYILLNVAILPEIDPNFEESAMEIDYVRVYQEAVLGTNDWASIDATILISNPVTDTLQLQVPSELVGANVKLYSLKGQELSSFELKGVQTSHNVSSFQAGMYLLKIEHASGIYTRKILKL